MMTFRPGGAQLIVPGVQVWQPMAGVSLDADATTLIAAMSVTPDSTRQTLISDTIIALKAAGVWTLLDELWFLAAHDAQAARLGWRRYKDATAVNSPTFTTDRGYAGNGSSSYLNTNFAPSTDGVNFALNDASFGVYSRTTAGDASSDMGTMNGSNVNMSYMHARWSGDNTFYGHLNVNAATSRPNAVVTTAAGLSVVRRTTSTASQIFRNGSHLATGTRVSSERSSVPFFIGAQNNNGTPSAFSAKQYAFAFVGASMSTQQQADLFTIVESYLDSIGAGVI